MAEGEKPQEVLDNVLVLFRDVNNKMGSVLEAQRTMVQDQQTVKGQVDRVHAFLFGDGFQNPGVTLRLDRLENSLKTMEQSKVTLETLRTKAEDLEHRLENVEEWKKDQAEIKKQWPVWVIVCTVVSSLGVIASCILSWKAIVK